MMLKNKVAVITGGGRGIGKAIAVLFAANGANVVIASRTAGELKGTAKEVKALNVRCLCVRADVADKKSAALIMKKAAAEFGRIDVLVNNAGVIGPVGPFAKNDADQWIKAVNINLIGTALCTKAALPYMLKVRSGKIINLSGGGATCGRPFFSAYASSKAAVVRFTETLAEELRPYNIQVNAIAPGAVNTKITSQILHAGKLAGKKELADVKRCLGGAGISPYRAAELAVYLASGESGGITGKLISAVWDDWKGFDKNTGKITGSALYTLRRIDGTHFKEAK